MSTSRGKIGRCPVEVRTEVNRMIRDNKQAATIIKYLSAQGIKGVTPQNVSSWKANGYQDWERRQHKLEAMASRREFARDVAERATADGDEDLTLVSNTAAALAVDAIQDVLEDFEPDQLKEMLAEKPAKFMDLIDALASLRKGDHAFVKLKMEFEEYKSRMRAIAADAKKRAAESGSADLKALADAMDRALGG